VASIKTRAAQIQLSAAALRSAEKFVYRRVDRGVECREISTGDKS